MLGLMPFIVFFLQFGALCLVWWHTTDRNKQDFIFWLIGLMLASQNGRFFGSVLIVQMRHLFIPMMIAAIAFRRQQLRNNLGSIAFLYLFLVATIFIASFWSQYPSDFLGLKLRRTVYACLMVFMAGTMRTVDDIRKLLWAILPNIILLAVGLQLGEREFVGEDRISINEANANTVGVFSGYLLFVAVMVFVFLKTKLWLRAILLFASLSGIAVLLSSGSRTALASCVVASLIAGTPLITSRKRFFVIGLPLFTLVALIGYKTWNKLAYSITDRLSMIATGGFSGREDVWVDGFTYLFQKKMWYGMGGIVQGFFINRQDFQVAPGINWGSTLNIYIDSIFETGVIGLCLWMLILINVIYRSFWLWKTKRTIYKYIPIAMCMFGLVQGFGESMPLRAEHPAGMLMIFGMVMLSAKRFYWNDFTYLYPSYESLLMRNSYDENNYRSIL